MESYTFGDLVGDEKLFFSEYFNKKPLLRKGALKGNPSDILSIGRLDELVNSEIIRPPYLRINLKGTGVPEKGYTRTVTVQGTDITDSIVPERVYELYRAGATLVWSSLNHIEPSLRSFCRVISDKFGARTDCVAFLTPAGKQGFSAHHDPVDLFIVQTEGTKRWRIWNSPSERLAETASYTQEELGEPSIEVLMEPGDVLYLPYDTPHAAAAEEKVSVHLSIMVRPRMWKELLQQTVETLMQEPEFNTFPYIGESRDADVESEFARKIASLAERMQTVDSESELDRLLDTGRYTDPGRPARIPVGDTFKASAELDVVNPDAQLRRTKVPVEFGANDNGRTQMSFKGHKIAVPSPVAEVLAGLVEGGLVRAADVFPDMPAERSAKTAQGLARLGVLEVVAAHA
ncbi:cupin domain-containing protein [Streptomyces sp. NBC_00344]|uniref:cupin domain-containing protein n=1 Tax=Streptomyces sp. NBC_00344 TaxID=2975720 RepID=UPI002E203777